MPDSPPQTLDELRRAIDATDDLLLDAMQKRMALAESVRAAKAGAPGPLWRPGREADILRRLLARNAGVLPEEAVYNIWRELISASLAAQGDFAIVAIAGSLGFAGGHFPNCAVDIVARPQDALDRVVSGASAAAELPGPDEDGVWPVLPKLLAARGRAPDLNILARLPMIDFADGADDDTGAGQSFIVGRAPCDRSADDMTLVASYWDAERRLPANPRKRPRLPEAEQKRAEAAAGTGAILAAVHDGLSVFAYEGFIEPGDARLAPLQHSAWLGAFARPFLIADDSESQEP
jgi:chorismate mutase / prephenate dehydratase